jgi:hypothetical protein
MSRSLAALAAVGALGLDAAPAGAAAPTRIRSSTCRARCRRPSATRTTSRATPRCSTTSSSRALTGRYEYDIVHTNSEFADQASDHDPQVVRLNVGG